MSNLAATAHSSIHTRLRAETAALHLSLETQMDLLGASLTLHRYRQVLAAFYGFYLPIEARLGSLTANAVPASFPLPTRHALLFADLLTLKLSREEISELPQCEQLPSLAQRNHLAGCLYVLEGASLGGQIISRVLNERLKLDNTNGASFFSGDGLHTKSRWKLVLNWLDAMSSSPRNSDEIVASACNTFTTLAQWMRQQGVLR